MGGNIPGENFLCGKFPGVNSLKGGGGWGKMSGNFLSRNFPRETFPTTGRLEFSLTIAKETRESKCFFK